jgi:hypothetical protein
MYNALFLLACLSLSLHCLAGVVIAAYAIPSCGFLFEYHHTDETEHATSPLSSPNVVHHACIGLFSYEVLQQEDGESPRSFCDPYSPSSLFYD